MTVIVGNKVQINLTYWAGEKVVTRELLMRPYTNSMHATAPVEARFIVLFLLIAYVACLAASAEQDHRAARCATTTKAHSPAY